MPKKKNPKPYEKLCSPIFLHDAWQKIYQNGLRSESRTTQESVRSFKENERKNIDRIYRSIQRRRYSEIFENAHGTIVGKKKRPVVLASVEARIVQRAILDVLQDLPDTKKYLNTPGSFGALKSEIENKKGVGPAIKSAVTAIKNGADHFYQSDIKKFFTQIPRRQVIDTIANYVDDGDFTNVLEDATNLEIKNINKIPISYRRFFDFNTIGTPQGCCLSPILGNILLYEFDVFMNSNGVTCLRYLDDFIVLGKGWKSVQDAFNEGAKLLNSLGLDVYKLKEKDTKAVSGNVSIGFDFLGVEIIGQNIRPNKESRKRLIQSIKEIANETFNQKFDVVSNKSQHDHSLISTLRDIDNKVKGWGNQYSFCNEASIWGDIDTEIEKIIGAYLGRYTELRNRLNQKSQRRLLGVHLVSESKKDPITW